MKIIGPLFTVLLIVCLAAVSTQSINNTNASPDRIELKANVSHLTADDVESIKLTAYVYDAQGNPVPDGTQVNFTIGNAECNAYTGGFTWGPDNGSFSEPPRSGTYISVTKEGRVSALFGWVPEGLSGNNSTIWAYINGTNIYNTTKIYFSNPMAFWTGRVVDSSGVGYGGIPATLHVMGYNGTIPYEIYNMTRITSSKQPSVGQFAFDPVIFQGTAYCYVDAEARSGDNLTLYGKSGNFSMSRSDTSIGDIVLEAPPQSSAAASPPVTARPVPGFEDPLALAGLLSAACLVPMRYRIKGR